MTLYPKMIMDALASSEQDRAECAGPNGDRSNLSEPTHHPRQRREGFNRALVWAAIGPRYR